uniref:site-specific DNA-methyltransferase (cytosine-N(4)-specific) n=1 Tax=uncultured miscellaneous Crenarchaeota group TaxID=1368239 RepID=W8RLW4_9ARCH|nr:putative RNA methylase [uncultured miscellaneous Crenarchaeota group]
MSEWSAKLIENVQFIYELALAELELEAFGVDFTVRNSLREFVLKNPPNIDRLVRRLAYFKTVGDNLTDYYRLTRYNRTRSVNQYLTHWIYPYKGKFHPQMIRALLNILKLKEKETVLDPFIGSGTTAVEAQLLGINCIGRDISPLCVLQSKVKTESIQAIDKIREYRVEATTSFKRSNTPLGDEEPNNKTYSEFLNSINDEQIKNFYLMAKLVAVSDSARRRREIVKSFDKNLALMIASVEDYRKAKDELDLQLGSVDISLGDARQLRLEDSSVQGIVTSPPYSIALDYVANDAHALEAMGCNPGKMREKFVGVRGKGETRIGLYNEDMQRSFQEMQRVLEEGRYCTIVIGNATYQQRKVETIEFTIEECEKLGFTLVKNINKIIYGLYNIMQTDNTLIFRKDN